MLGEAANQCVRALNLKLVKETTKPEEPSKSFAESMGRGRGKARCQKSGAEKERGKKARHVVYRPHPGLGCVCHKQHICQRGQRKTEHTVVSCGLDLNVFRFCGLLQNVGR